MTSSNGLKSVVSEGTTKIEDYTEDINVRCYVLYVYHRWKASGEIGHIQAKYQKRTPYQIKQMENVREFFHKNAMEYLKLKGFKEEEISVFLENECEKETKRTLPEGLQCGCCRMLVEDWKEHQKTTMHKELEDRVYAIHTLWMNIQAEKIGGSNSSQH